MRKTLFFLFFFALQGPVPAVLSAGEPEDSAASVSPGSDISQGPEIIPEESEPPKTGPGGQAATGVAGSGDLDIFRLNIADHPQESVAALLRLLPGKEPAEIDAFRRQYSAKIAELMFTLHKAALENRIPAELYRDVTERLAPFDLRTPHAREFPDDARWRRPPHERRRQNEVDSLVDARLAADSGDKKKAEEILLGVMAENPRNPSVHTAVAVYYNGESKFPQAERTATTAITLSDQDPDAYKARALARASLNNRKGAIEDIKRAMAIDPQDESARVLSALLESRKAVPTLKSISSADEMRRALGSGDEAAVVVGEDAAVEPPGGQGKAGVPDFARSRAYLKTAVAKNRLGDYEDAARYASLAIEKDPGNYEAYLERANAYNFLGRYDDAIRDAGRVIDEDPSNMQAFNMRAWSLNRKGQAEQALSDASRAIGIDPGYADAWFNRALAYEKQGDYRRMLDDFKRAALLSSAYSLRYKDAVAQYGPRVPGYQGAAPRQAAAAAERGERPAGEGTPLRRFLTMLFFTLTGGGLIAAGLLHIMSSREAGPSASARSTHPDILSPSVFYEGVATGKYKIERKLGEGAMGVVYEATDQSLGRKVAIKKMGDEIKLNSREKQRFLEEARTVALLHHPGIVEIYTIFEEEENVYLVFEHVSGQTLDKVLEQEGRLEPARALKLFSEAAAALAYAHSKNVVHRDLKLSNIMLSPDEGVKLMDFGLASRAKESMFLSGREVVGSPAYMAPEQELGSASVHSDIYSMGVCLYEALSGVMPFPGPDFHKQKSRMAYQKLSASVSGLPAGLDAVVARCLDPDPGRRYGSAAELRRALEALA